MEKRGNKMKRYRLLKDLPDVKTGVILELVFEPCYCEEVYTYKTKEGLDYHYDKRYVENNLEWFEKIAEEYKAGDWVKHRNYKYPHKILEINEKTNCYTAEISMIESSLFKGQVFENLGFFYTDRLATDEEVGNFLSEVAVFKGFVSGAHFKPIEGKCIWVKTGKDLRFEYNKNNESLEWWGGTSSTPQDGYIDTDGGFLIIYANGKWAEIAEQKKEEPINIGPYYIVISKDTVKLFSIETDKLVAAYSKESIESLLDTMRYYYMNAFNVHSCSGDSFTVTKKLIEKIYEML